MKLSLVILVLLLLASSFAIVFLKNAKGSGRTGAYRKRRLMTENEEEFFGRLVVALPDHYIFPQVAMSALLEPSSSDQRTAHGDRLRIAQQRVDYVVCTRSGDVVVVVELDDRTHARGKDQTRDARLEQAGIRTVRFQSRQKPKLEAIRATILGSDVVDVNTVPKAPADQGSAAANDTLPVPQ